MSEVWDLYDKDKNLIGKKHERGKKLEAGEYHLVVSVWIVNSDGQILLTKRHSDKLYGGLWEAPGGAVLSSEDSIQGAKRELFEETGIESSHEELLLLGTLLITDWITDTYLLRKSVSLDKLSLQNEEVTEAKWINIAGFDEMCSKSLIVPSVVNQFKLYRENIMRALK